jgi:hypothetical protein
MQIAIAKSASALLLVVLLVVVVGCGSSGDGSTSTTKQRTVDVADRSAAFRGPGLAAEIVEFGREAPAAIREEASPFLAKNLKARADGDWSGQCATLSTKEAKKLGNSSTSTKVLVACEEGLKKLATPLKKTEAARADTFDGHIDAMRVKGNTAYALYHGTDGTDYMMPMELKRGVWKVASIETIALD